MQQDTISCGVCSASVFPTCMLVSPPATTRFVETSKCNGDWMAPPLWYLKIFKPIASFSARVALSCCSHRLVAALIRLFLSEHVFM